MNTVIQVMQLCAALEQVNSIEITGRWGRGERETDNLRGQRMQADRQPERERERERVYVRERNLHQLSKLDSDDLIIGKYSKYS